MGYLKYVKNAFSATSDEQRERDHARLIQYRRENVLTRIERPTRIDRARAIGYVATQGVVLVRTRVNRGSHTRPDIKGGRRPKRFHQRRDLSKNYQQIAEEKASRAYKNCSILGSYQVAEDGKNTWYEVILVDRMHAQVLSRQQLLGIAVQGGRAQRGLTSAGRKARGLTKKGQGSEKTRPSKRAHNRLH